MSYIVITVADFVMTNVGWEKEKDNARSCNTMEIFFQI